MREINLNDTVLVKLNDSGREELKRNHDELYSWLDLDRKYVPNPVDEDGFSKFQLWCLISELGHMIHIGNDNLPFETTIKIED